MFPKSVSVSVSFISTLPQTKTSKNVFYLNKIENDISECRNVIKYVSHSFGSSFYNETYALVQIFCSEVRMNYNKYSRAAEEEKGRSNKTIYVITCTKYGKRMVKRIKQQHFKKVEF